MPAVGPFGAAIALDFGGESPILLAMGAVHRTIVLAGALLGGAALSQAPEFTQQYRQRLGGAMAELQQFVADFDRDAKANGLSRAQALGAYAHSTEKFLNDRGLTMQGVLDRFDRLDRQSRDFASMAPVMRPFGLLTEHDRKVWSGAWRDFEPAMPLTAHGAVWAAIGAAVGALLIWFPAPIARHARRRWQRRGGDVLSHRQAPERGDMRG